MNPLSARALLAPCLIMLSLLACTAPEDATGPTGPGAFAGCKAGLSCPPQTPLCHPVLGTCVQCVSDGTCLGQTPYCHPTQGVCMACVGGAHCPTGQTCVGGLCSTAAGCSPGEVLCNAHELWTCHLDGQGYDTIPCPVTCVDGKCALCEPGEHRCQDNAVEVCDTQGFGWLYSLSCESSCLSGQCIECVPGSLRCSGDSVETCAQDGQGYQVKTNCQEQGQGLVCVSGQCIDPCSSDFKFNTNMGCEYWAVDLDQTFEGDSHNSPFALVVSNVNLTGSAQVTLYRNGEIAGEADVPPSGLHIFDVEPHNVDGSMQAMRSFRLKSTRPIIAYQFNPLENVGVFSNDASMLIPQNSLGDTYRVMGWPQRPGDLHGYVTIVATEADTQVTVQVTAHTLAGPGGVPALSPGQSHITTLQPYEVLSIETGATGEDLTGSLVTADKPIAVFSGHECANVPDTTGCGVNGKCQNAPSWSCSSPDDCPSVCCCDHLEEQLFAVSAWGKVYVAPRSTPRGNESDHWRVLASEDETVVTLSPPVAGVPLLAAGEVYDFPAVDSFVLTSNKPVLLGQFLASEHAPNVSAGICVKEDFFGFCDNLPSALCFSDNECVGKEEPGDAGIGDPAFILAVPTEQLRTNYVFLVPNKYAADHLAIYAPMTATVTLDGQSLAGEIWKPIADGWRILHKPVPDGVHTLEGTESFGVMVHGYDQYVSYGYPAGMNLGVLP